MKWGEVYGSGVPCGRGCCTHSPRHERRQEIHRGFGVQKSRAAEEGHEVRSARDGGSQRGGAHSSGVYRGSLGEDNWT